MFRLNMRSNANEVAEAYGAAARFQVPFATSLALNWTAREVKDGERSTMQQVFDRPTTYTLNSQQITPATKDKLVAEVWFKNFGGKGYAATEYLTPQVFGGGRPLKRFELAMQRMGWLNNGMMAVPGAGAKLDRYGNMRRSQIVQIMSWLKAFSEQGFKANVTPGTKAKRIAKTGVTYFVSRGKGTWFGGGSWKEGHPQHLAPGIWMRKGRTIKPVIMFVHEAHYRVLFAYHKVAQSIFDKRIDANFAKALEYALRTARPPWRSAA